MQKIKLGKHEIPLDENFAQWYGIYLGDGDNVFSKGRVAITNNSTDILLFHMLFIKSYFQVPNSRIRIETYAHPDSDKNEVIEKFSKDFEITKDRISFSTRKYATKPGARILFWDKDLKIAIMGKLKVLKKISSQKKLTRKFLSGIFAAEGEVKKYGFSVRIVMKERLFLENVKKLLENVGIQTSEVRYSRFHKSHEMTMCGKNNLTKFYKEIGFWPHLERQKRLENKIDSYEREPIEEKNKIILKYLKKTKRATIKKVAFNLNLKYDYTALLLRRLRNKGLVKRAKFRAPYELVKL